MSARVLSIERDLTTEEMADPSTSGAVVAQMIADLQVSMIERGLEPQSGRPQLQIELVTTPGKEHERAWWEVLLCLPAQREPAKVHHRVTISASAIPAPRGGDL